MMIIIKGKYSISSKKFYLLFIICFSLLFDVIFAQDLIKKNDLFNTLEINKVTYWTQPKKLIFVTSNKNNTLYIANPENVSKKDSIQFSNKLQSFIIYKDNIVGLIKKDNTFYLEKYNLENNLFSKIELENNLIPYKLVTHSKTNFNLIVAMVYNVDDKSSNHYLINLENNEFKLIENKEKFTNLYFDGDINPIAGNKTNDQGGTSLFIKSLENKWIEISKNQWDVSQFLGGFQKILSVSNDGNHIYFLDNVNSDKTRLKRYDRTTSRINVINESEIGDLLPFGFSLNEKNEVTSIVTLFDKTYRYYSDKKTQKDFVFIEEKLKTNIRFVDYDDPNTKWVIRTLDGKPSDYYLFDRKTKKIQFLVTDFPDLKEKYQFAERNGYIITTSDNLKLPIHVYLPPDSDKDKNGIPDKPLPTVVFSHGGPWVGVVHWNGYYFWRNYQLLANRGYAVIVMEFRGSSGYGKNFVDKSNFEWGKKMLDDKIQITEWAVKNKIAKKGKIGIWGWSYGGYAVLSSLAFKPNVFACGISMFPPSDLVAFMKLPQYGETNLWNNRVGNSKSEEGLKLLHDISPINHIDEINKPLLLTAGAQDKMVPIDIVDNFAFELAKKKKPFTYITYANEGHDYQNPENWISFWNYGEEFLKRYLGGKSEKTMVDLGNKILTLKYNFLNLN